MASLRVARRSCPPMARGPSTLTRTAAPPFASSVGRSSVRHLIVSVDVLDPRAGGHEKENKPCGDQDRCKGPRGRSEIHGTRGHRDEIYAGDKGIHVGLPSTLSWMLCS